MYDISRFLSFLQIVRLRLTFFNIDFLENEGVLSKEEVTVSVCIERLHAARISLLVIAEQITAANRGKRKIINRISEPKLKSEFPLNFISEVNPYPISISYPTFIPDTSHVTVDTSSRLLKSKSKSKSGCPHLLLPPILSAQRSGVPCAVTAVYSALLDAPLSATLLSKYTKYILEYVQCKTLGCGNIFYRLCPIDIFFLTTLLLLVLLTISMLIMLF